MAELLLKCGHVVETTLESNAVDRRSARRADPTDVEPADATDVRAGAVPPVEGSDSDNPYSV
ncbi:hypothetical protein SAMN04489841_3138 [Natrinema salaciae]|uniref:Uncharacterized protein n=1 Tax=Natrinema salaciae TaxID=1186196 RepID=A0A1H9LYS3_9EURY|nr:hypothetical protein SAMN04489841_3138 [Natrinema salaciae]